MSYIKGGDIQSAFKCQKFSTFGRFICNDSSLELETIGRLPYDKQSWITLNEPVGERVRYNEGVHSFGGCTVVINIL